MKTRVQQVVLSLIFLVVYDVSVFLLVKDMTDSQWISLAFVHAAYGVLLWLAFSVPEGKDRAVLGYPGVLLGVQYFGIELVLGTVYLMMRTASVAWTLIPQMVLAGAYVALMIRNSLTNQKIAVDTARDEGHIDYIRQSVAALQRIRLVAADPELARRLDKVEDALRYAQVTSDPSVAGLESDTMVLLDRLAQSVQAGEHSAALALCDALEKVVASRNTSLASRRRV